MARKLKIRETTAPRPRGKKKAAKSQDRKHPVAREKKDIENPIVPRCTAPWQSLMIEGNGTVQPCAYRGNYGNASMHPPLGNVNTQTIAEIWNGEEVKTLRRLMAAGDLKAAGCGSCLAVAQNQPLQLSYDTKVDEPTHPPSLYKNNLDLKREEMALGLEEIESKPLVLYVTPTHRCNLRCTHCYETPTRGETIRRGGFQEEVEDLLPFLSELVPGGGEPMILSFWNKIFRVNNRAVNPHLRLAFTTGGHHVEDSALDSIGRYTEAQVMVSFDAPNVTTFEAIRKNGSFEQVLQNIVKFRDITNRKREGSTVMHISVMKQNIRLLPEMLRLAATLEIPFNFQPVVAYPLDHSLRAFEFGPAGAEGWEDALQASTRIIENVLIPALHASAATRGRKLSDKVEKSLTDHIGALRNLIPWHVLEKEHVHYKSAIPEYQMEYMKIMSRWALKDQQKGQKMNIVFFPKLEAGYGEPHHFAKLRRDGSYDAWLPKGEYHAVINRRENHAVAFNGVDITV